MPLVCTCGMLKCSLAPPSTYSWPCMRSGDGAMMRPLELSELCDTRPASRRGQGKGLQVMRVIANQGNQSDCCYIQESRVC